MEKLTQVLTDAHNLLMRIQTGEDDFFSITDWDEQLGHIEHVLNLDTERARAFRVKYSSEEENMNTPGIPKYQYDHWFSTGEQDYRITGFTGRYLEMKEISESDFIGTPGPSILIACAYMDGFKSAMSRARAKGETFTVSWETVSPLRATASVNGCKVGYVTISTKIISVDATETLPNYTRFITSAKFRCSRDSWSRGLREIDNNTEIDKVDLRVWSHFAIRAYVDYYSGTPVAREYPGMIEKG